MSKNNVNLSEVTEMYNTYSDVEKVKKDLKSIQSIKCRLKKQKAIENYDQKMTEIVKKEQLLKEVKAMFEPKKMTVTTMSENDIKLLDYDSTIKAIKSIQSKKCNTQYLTKDVETNVEYQDALRIEKMLLEHKAMLVSTQNNTIVKKSSLNDLIQQLESTDSKVSKEFLLEQLKNMI